MVPDGALAALPKGDPLPASHLPAWSERSAGQLITRDHDAVDYRIEAGAKPADEVEFVLNLGDGLTWRKELGLHAKDGDWTIAVQDRRLGPGRPTRAGQARRVGVLPPGAVRHRHDRRPVDATPQASNEEEPLTGAIEDRRRRLPTRRYDSRNAKVQRPTTRGPALSRGPQAWPARRSATRRCRRLPLSWSGGRRSEGLLHLVYGR